MKMDDYGTYTYVLYKNKEFKKFDGKVRFYFYVLFARWRWTALGFAKHGRGACIINMQTKDKDTSSVQSLRGPASYIEESMKAASEF